VDRHISDAFIFLLYVRGCPRDFNAVCPVCEIWGAHSSVNVDSDFVGCDAVTGIISSHTPIFRVMQLRALKAKAL
jgi:hypothetical protein